MPSDLNGADRHTPVTDPWLFESAPEVRALCSAGIEYLGALARVGANVPTIAERFGVSEKWLRGQVQTNEAAATAWRQNKAKDKLDVLVARVSTGEAEAASNPEGGE
jgi:hypothetical protein